MPIFSQQAYVNKEWVSSTGAVGNIHRTVSTLDSNQNLIVVGNTLNAFNNTDVLISKYNSDGVLLWQQTFNGFANADDNGVQIRTNLSNEIFIAAYLTTNTGVDFGILKYSANGTLVWSNTWDGVISSVDIPLDLAVDNLNNTYLVGATLTANNQADYAIVKFNSNGVLQWENTYDYANLYDVATSVKVSNNSLIVTGTSASSANNWDFATLRLNNISGEIENIERSEVPGLGLDNAQAVTTDINNNIYITGYIEYDGNRNIQTIKLDVDFNLVWIKTFDGGFEDIAKAIGVDDFGNIFVAGTQENENGGKDYLTIKYDSNGVELWAKEFGSEGNQHIATSEQIAIVNGEVVVTGTLNKNGVKEFATLKYSSDGDLKFVKKYDAGYQINEAKSVIAKGDDIYVSGISVINGESKNTSVKYSIKEKPFEIENGENGEKYVFDELLIRFDTSAVYYDVIDDREFTAGVLSDFVKPEIISEMNQKTKIDWERAEVYKIFLRMTTADSLSITRLGDTIRLDNYWATLSVFIPLDSDHQIIEDSLNTMFPTIHYAEKNFIAELNSIPNDPLFLTEQSGLHSPPSAASHDINLLNVWDKQVGTSYTKVGVYDSGINWRHEDYGDGTVLGTKISGGWDFVSNVSPFSQTTPDDQGHGTATSGIIGALRNNGKGIAGIAGGDMQNGNTGCRLFSMKIFNTTLFATHSVISSAIIEGASNNPDTGYGYGLHIQNHSWGSSSGSLTLKNAIKQSFELNCLMVVSSGNYPSSICNEPDCIMYPASFNDSWVIKVGASNANGDKASFSVYDNNLDVIAPGTNDIYATLDHNNNAGYFYDGNGTSFSAPHVSGVSALLLSEHNTNNEYPNNLAPEDIENLLQNYATDVNEPNYDIYSGYGRVNAGDSFSKMQLPKHFIKHSGNQDNSSQQTTEYGLQVVVVGNINGVSSGFYFADKVQVNHTFIDVFEPTQSVIDHWPRYSSSVGVSAANPITGETWFTYTPTINQNVASITTTTFCWHINTTITGQSVNTWIPTTPSQLNTAYSLHVHDSAEFGVDEVEVDNGFSIYPNPTYNYITMDFDLEENVEANLIIYNAIGVVVAKHSMDGLAKGKHTIDVNLSHLSSGLYVCKLSLGAQIITNRIIKN